MSRKRSVRLGGYLDNDRGGFGCLVAISALIHLSGGGLLALASTPFANAAPVAIQVDLVASLPTVPGRASAKMVKKKPAARPTPPRPKQVVLPKQSTTRVAKVQPARAREFAYEDALSQLREELGEPAEAGEVVENPADSSAMSRDSGRTAKQDPEVVAWMIATRRHVRSVWVTPPEFLERSLRTEMWIEIAADGTVLGPPRVTESSGDPFWDDNAVRAMLNASPLPAPPSPGQWRVAFTPRGEQ